MDNDTYLHNSTVIKKLDDLSVAIGGSEVPTTTTKTNSDFVIGINKSIDAASGKTGVEYPPYSHNTLVTNKLDELAEAISEGGGGGPAPVMGALTATENGNYIPSDYDYDGFNRVSVNVPEPPAPVTDVLSVTENGTYLPSDYSCDAFSQVNVNVAPTPSGYNIPSIELIYNSPLSTASEEYTITTDGLYFIAVGFTHKGSATLILPQDVTPIRQQDLIMTASGVQRGVKYALTRLSIGDVITIGSTAGDWLGQYRYIIKLDDSLTITPTPVHESAIGDALTTYTITDNDHHLIFSMDTSRNGYDNENYQKLESSVKEVGLWFTTSDNRGKCHVSIISNAANKATYYGYGYNGGFSSLIDFVCSYSPI